MAKDPNYSYMPYIVNQLKLLLKMTSQQSAQRRTLTSRKQNTTFCCANSRLKKIASNQHNNIQ